MKELSTVTQYEVQIGEEIVTAIQFTNDIPFCAENKENLQIP